MTAMAAGMSVGVGAAEAEAQGAAPILSVECTLTGPGAAIVAGRGTERLRGHDLLRTSS